VTRRKEMVMGAHDAAMRLVDAFNEGDWDALRAAVVPDVVYLEAGTGRRVEGVDDYIALCRGWKEAFPDVRGTVERSLEGEDVVAQDVIWEGTHTGPLATPNGTIPPSGRRVSVSATVWANERDGRVAEVRHHLDVMALMAQIGALPA
jgi:steroid delta-isomerase-like uncharacterized protein